MTPLNVENPCEQVSTCKAKEVTTTHRGTENTTTEKEICLSQRKRTVHQLHIVPPQETHLPFLDSKITELCTEEEQALLLYLLFQICNKIPLKL